MVHKGVIIGSVGAVLLIIILVIYLMSSSSDDTVVAAATTVPAAQSAPVSTYPPGLKEGDSVGAAGLGIWLLTPGGTRRHFTPEGYAKAGSPPYTQITTTSMEAIPVGGTAI